MEQIALVRPARFGFDPETAATNTFQSRPDTPATEAAQREHDRLAESLESAGIAVLVLDDTPEPEKPDAVFPNNWVSFHEDGTVVLYPMAAPRRRAERRPELIRQICERTGFAVRRTVDLSAHERQGRYLEGTGSLVLDPVHRVAYACRSPRTDPGLASAWGEALGYEVVLFEATDRKGVPLYHTNVALCVGARACVVAAEAIAPADRERVVGRLASTGRTVVEISREQVAAFAGNVLEVEGLLGRTWAMSQSARRALGADLERLGGDAVVAVPIPVIERVGGGSVRCAMLQIPSTAAASSPRPG